MVLRIASIFAAVMGLLWLLRRTDVYTHSLGLRINNPGNIKFNEANDWVGQIGEEGGFVWFDTPEHGIRAMGILLESYDKIGVDTIREVIERYAPPEDNNPTEVYVENVSRWVGQGPDYPLWVGRTSREEMELKLVKAIIRQEQGIQPYSDEFIQGALQLA